MNIGNNENHKMTNEYDYVIDYDKYLCDLHKLEVDKILNNTQSKNNSHQCS